MPTLTDYQEFNGLHWETGSIRNILAYQGVTMSHTGQPISEALLLGISGGVIFGYFAFHYEGYDPFVAPMTRNTFTPMTTIYERLAIPRDIRQTSNENTGVKNLIDVLEEGKPAMIWGDIYMLPYNALEFDPGNLAMFPLVVYGYEPDQNLVHLADRARVPLTTTTDDLKRARSRVKKEKFRVMALDAPDQNKLTSAVQMGIFDCIKLFTENPPKGSKHNFGFAAMDKWIELLTRPGSKNSWFKFFPAGRSLYTGLTSAFNMVRIFGHDGGGERDMYADFLNEAALILDRPVLTEVAELFRESAAAWCDFGDVILADDVSPFKETRDLTLKRHHDFLNRGNDATDDMRRIDLRLEEIKKQMETDFPLSEEEVTAYQERIAAQLGKIREIEREAINMLQAAMG